VDGFIQSFCHIWLALHKIVTNFKSDNTLVVSTTDIPDNYPPLYSKWWEAIAFYLCTYVHSVHASVWILEMWPWKPTNSYSCYLEDKLSVALEHWSVLFKKDSISLEGDQCSGCPFSPCTYLSSVFVTDGQMDVYLDVLGYPGDWPQQRVPEICKLCTRHHPLTRWPMKGFSWQSTTFHRFPPS
jgi:hypothetical protein